MAFDPAQSLSNYNVYKSGQNSINNSEKPAERLQPSNQNQPRKAKACNKKNIYGAESKGFKVVKLARQTIRENRSQDKKNELFIEAVKKGDAKWVKEWLNSGADVNTADNEGITPLFEAARRGRIEIVKLLLSHPDIDVNHANGRGQTLLHWAAKKGHLEIVKLLLSRPEIDVNTADKRGKTLLHWTAKKGHLEIVKLLLLRPEIDVNKADNEGWTVLHWAASKGDFETVKLLLSHFKIDVNQADQDGETPLYWAAWMGHIEIVKLLLSRPEIDVNKTDNYWDSTPLNRAAKEGLVDAVKLLLSHPKIDVNKADNEGWTVLHWTASKGDFETIKLLLSHPKIDVNQADQDGETPLWWATRMVHVEIVKLLLSHSKINMDEDARRYLDRLVDTNDVYSIQEIVLNGCSKKVYDHLYTKAIEIGKPQLIKRLRHLVPGYSNTEALGGHYKAYAGKGSVPKGILRTVEKYLNSNLPEQQR